MANRAYLWASALPTTTNLDDWSFSEPYYDSRWTMPLAWFFLFHPQDLRMVDITHERAIWTELRLAAARQDAISTFQRRRRSPASVIAEDQERAGIIDRFISRISAWLGTHLLVDPSQVCWADEEDYARFHDILSAIDTGNPDSQYLAECLKRYASVRYSDIAQFERDVVGYTYWSV